MRFEIPSKPRRKETPPMKIDPKDFRVAPGKAVDLAKWPTKVKPVYKSKQEYHEALKDHVAHLSELQRVLYASGRHALLLIFQGMDASGKDGAIRHVLSGINPQGCEVHSFKQPSASERQHDFLWRTTKCLPERGRIGIFNRSYYEEILVAKVHPEILEGQGFESMDVEGKGFWQGRYESIVDLESHLDRNGTRILKFYLHLSKAEQKRRFLERIDDEEKNWKFSTSDIQERKFWKQYTKAFEQALEATSTHHAPWHVVPADDKENARLIISRIVLDAMAHLKMKFPKTTPEHHEELVAIRGEL
jgi:PPK2 family polyphosphate:nucleotide phosphotransferase